MAEISESIRETVPERFWLDTISLQEAESLYVEGKKRGKTEEELKYLVGKITDWELIELYTDSPEIYCPHCKKHFSCFGLEDTSVCPQCGCTDVVQKTLEERRKELRKECDADMQRLREFKWSDEEK